MFTLYSDKLQLVFDPFYSKREAIYPPYNQISEQKILINSLAIKLKEFQEQWYQRGKQQQEELHQLRELYHNKQHNILIDKQQKISIDALDNKLKMFQEQWYQRSK